jgi:peptidoglycan/LPS O-acetylase OafA/YrhL
MTALYMTREIWFRIGQPVSPRFNPAYLDQLVVTAIILILLLSELKYRFLERSLRLKGREISRQFEERHSGSHAQQS